VRYWVLGILGFNIVLLTGCAALDAFFGVSEGGPSNPGSAPSNVAGGLLSGVVPWVGNALFVLTSLYQKVRHKQWANVAESVIKGVNEGIEMKDADGKINVQDLLAKLKKQQELAGSREGVNKVIKSLPK
jgi:hypothetical protein